MLARHLHALLLIGMLAGLWGPSAAAPMTAAAQSATTPAPTTYSAPPTPSVTPTATSSTTSATTATASGTPSASATPSPVGTPSAASPTTGTPTAGATASGTPSANPAAATPSASPNASPSLAPSPTPRPSPTPDRFFGAVQALYAPNRATELGVQWERVLFPWSLIQKEGPDAWDKGYFTDDQINQEVARGIQVVGLAIYTPQWATSKPKDPKVTNMPLGLYLPFDDPKNYWGQYMYKLASRYKGKIDTWTIWNEPDMISDQILYTWDGTLNDFYQLQKIGYQAVKKANPDAKIALPGTTYWWDHDAFRPLWLARYIQTAAQDPTAAANGDYFDIVDIHQYQNPLNIYAAVEVYQRTLTQFGLPDKPIWIGESNVVPYDDPTNPIVKPLHATMDQQAAYVLEGFALARAAGAARMSIYKMLDEGPEGPGELYGLVRNDGSTRPAFDAYKTAVKYLSNPTQPAIYTWEGASEPPTTDELSRLLSDNDHHPQWLWPAAINRVMLERNDQRISIVWNASGKLATAHIPAVAKSAQVLDKFGKDTGELVAKDGQYSLELQPSTNNTDFRDPSLLLVGGDPRIVVEKVTPPPDTVDAPIQVLWPKDPNTANVTGILLQPNSTQPVPCRWNPTVRLFAQIDGGPTQVLATAAKRMLTEDGLTYPVWDFNNVNIAPANQGRTMEFWIDVDGIATHTTRLVYPPAAPATPDPNAAPNAAPDPTSPQTTTPDVTPPTPTSSCN